MTPADSHEHILEPLRMAIQLEQEGRKFFLEAARSVQSKFAQQTFEFLAAEENKHIERIKEFYESIEQPAGKEPPAFDEQDADRRLRAFNERLVHLKEEIEPTASDVEAYRLALKFENGAEELYARQLKESQDPVVKKFYRWLVREEEMHSRLLRSCLEFAEDPAGWFQKQKS
jgi:rubrerythrin